MIGAQTDDDDENIGDMTADMTGDNENTFWYYVTAL